MDADSARALNKRISEHYDRSTGEWEDELGDHMHQGFYDLDGSTLDHKAAQTRMIEEALRFAGLSEDPKKWPKKVVDVGCGVGGSSFYLANKYGAKCKGINLSAGQVQRANSIAAAQGLAHKVSFQVADALDQPFSDGQFDLVWVLDTAQHIPNKKKFVSELARVAAPGGTIIITTWCQRDLGPSEESLQDWEKQYLKKMNDNLFPDWCSTSDYVQLLNSLSLQDIKTADWTEHLAPFWPAMFRSVFTWKGLTSTLLGGLQAIRGVMVMPMIMKGFKKGVIKNVIITCRKPE